MNKVDKMFANIPVSVLPGFELDMFKSERMAMLKSTEAASGTDSKKSSPILHIENNVGIISVSGKLVDSDSPSNRFFNLISYNQVKAAAIEAVEKGVGSILYIYKSPGGVVSGMKGFADFNASLKLPTISFTSSTMASAALFCGLSSDSIYCDSMAEVGSVGVIMSVVNYKNMLDKDGITVDILRSGTHKSAGNPYEKLVKKNKEYLLGQVNYLAEQFYSYVADRRGISVDSMGDIKTGKTFIGEQAFKAGLVDKILTFDEVFQLSVQKAEKFLDRNKYIGNNYRINKANEDTMKKYGLKKLGELLADSNVDLNDVDVAGSVADAVSKLEAAESDLASTKEKFDESQVALAAAETKITTLEASVKALEEDAEDTENSAASLVEAVSEQISKMRSALSLSEVDMSKWKAEAVAEEYKTVLKAYKKAFVAGGVVPPADSGNSTKAVDIDFSEGLETLGIN